MFKNLYNLCYRILKYDYKPLNYDYKNKTYSGLIYSNLKETRNSFKKWPFTLWWISSKTITEVGNIT